MKYDNTILGTNIPCLNEKRLYNSQNGGPVAQQEERQAFTTIVVEET